MTDRTASRSDARKRRLERDMADAHATARERDAQATPSEVTAKVRAFWAEIAAAVKPLTAHYTYDPARDQVIDNLTGEITRLSKEDTLTAKARHDELKALLNKISEESVSTSNVLADVLDLLRERLPKAYAVKFEPFKTGNLKPYQDAMRQAAESIAASVAAESADSSPTDDLPGEPVEPGDLRAGDRVAFTWWGVEHSTCTLVSVAGGSILRADANDAGDRGIPYVVIRGEWAGGISDVRLLERAPREDEGPDEALAPDYAIEDVLDEVEATLNRQKVGVRAEVVGDSLRLSTLTGAVFLAAHDPSEGLIASQRLLRRATKAETERDEWKARHEALREDVETRWAFVDDNFLKDILHSILKGDDERAKGADQR